MIVRWVCDIFSLFIVWYLCVETRVVDLCVDSPSPSNVYRACLSLCLCVHCVSAYELVCETSVFQYTHIGEVTYSHSKRPNI